MMRSTYPDVKFVPTTRTGSILFKAPYALISAMVDYAREAGEDRVLLINSDIVMHDPRGDLSKYQEDMDAVVIANRHDHDGDGSRISRYDYGFDAFLLSKQHFDLFPQTLFAMGQTWWDYWIPYRFIKAGVRVVTVKEPLFLHKRHRVQYDQKEWERMTQHFIWVENWTSPRKAPQQVTNEVYRFIRQHAR